MQKPMNISDAIIIFGVSILSACAPSEPVAIQGPTTAYVPETYPEDRVRTAARSDFVLIGDTGDGEEFIAHFANPSTIQRDGKYLGIWVLSNYARAQSKADGRIYYSTLIFRINDCQDKKSGIEQIAYYRELGGSGPVVDSITVAGPEIEMYRIVPGSAGEGMLAFVCSRQLR